MFRFLSILMIISKSIFNSYDADDYVDDEEATTKNLADFEDEEIEDSFEEFLGAFVSERQLRPVTDAEVPGFPFPDDPPDILTSPCYIELITCITNVLDGTTPSPTVSPTMRPPNQGQNMNMMNMQPTNPLISVRTTSAGSSATSANMMMMRRRANGMMMMMNNANARQLRNEVRNIRDLDSNTYFYRDNEEVDLEETHSKYGLGRRGLGYLEESVPDDEDREKVCTNDSFLYASSAIDLGSWSGNVKNFENQLPNDQMRIHVPDRIKHTPENSKFKNFVFGAEDRFFAHS